MFERIANRNRYDIVYEKIKENIIENIFKPGEKLNIEKISKELGVSRTPVSNAMQALERSGYVEILPQNGTYVKELTKDEIIVIYDFREVIEGFVVKLVISSLDKEKLITFYNRLKDLQIVQNEDKDIIQAFYELEIEFHEFLLSYCPGFIKEETRNVIDLTKRTRKLNLQYELKNSGIGFIVENDIKIHMKLTQALIDGDVIAAQHYAMMDVRETKEHVLRYLYNYE